MNCPYCNKEMNEGFIFCHSGFMNMRWKSDADDTKRLIHPWYQNFTETRIKNVFYCQDCDLIIKKFDKAK